jgi:hypothetical protein
MKGPGGGLMFIVALPVRPSALPLVHPSAHFYNTKKALQSIKSDSSDTT